MLLKLIKTRQFISGAHCELWEINHLTGNKHMANVFVLNEHIPLELIYRLTIRHSGIFIQSQQCGWQWENPNEEKSVTDYLLSVQAIHEEIRIEVCVPEPYLPGYPHVDRNPDDYPVVFGDFD
jgi:hypothetical protein